MTKKKTKPVKKPAKVVTGEGLSEAEHGQGWERDVPCETAVDTSDQDDRE